MVVKATSEPFSVNVALLAVTSVGVAFSLMTMLVVTVALSTAASLTFQLMVRASPGSVLVVLKRMACSAFCHWARVAVSLSDVSVSSPVALSKVLAVMLPMLRPALLKLSTSLPLMKPLLMRTTAEARVVLSWSATRMSGATSTEWPPSS